VAKFRPGDRVRLTDDGFLYTGSGPAVVESYDGITYGDEYLCYTVYYPDVHARVQTYEQYMAAYFNPKDPT
jgi:hypothetical protein